MTLTGFAIDYVRKKQLCLSKTTAAFLCISICLSKNVICSIFFLTKLNKVGRVEKCGSTRLKTQNRAQVHFGLA